MTGEPGEPIRCEHCGFVVEQAMELIAAKQRQLEDIQRDLIGKRTRIRNLERERARQPMTHPLYPLAEKIFDYWRERLMPKAREFDHKRSRPVLARLSNAESPEAGYETIRRAIDGAALLPYVTNQGRSATGEPSERQVELELICRTEANMMRFASYVADETKVDLVPARRMVVMQNNIDRPQVLARLHELKGWSAEAVLSLGLGLDADRVVFFARDAEGQVTGMHRYQPNPAKLNGRPKMLAQGSRELFPAPEEYDGSVLWLVEGEPDAVAMRSLGHPGVGVPGLGKWRDEWTERFDRFEKVYIVFDCDDPGREAARIRQGQLASVTSVTVVDLDPARSDSYDLGDLLLEHGGAAASLLSSLATVSQGPSSGWQPPLGATRPYERILELLRARDLRVIENAGRASSQCPNHDDTHPSLSVGEGDDGRVLLHCHVGCSPEEICRSIGIQLRDLFVQR